jgi:hypothetical protein
MQTRSALCALITSVLRSFHRRPVCKFRTSATFHHQSVRSHQQLLPAALPAALLQQQTRAQVRQWCVSQHPGDDAPSNHTIRITAGMQRSSQHSVLGIYGPGCKAATQLSSTRRTPLALALHARRDEVHIAEPKPGLAGSQYRTHHGSYGPACNSKCTNTSP